MDEIEWALVTSANLSTQAWGTAMNAGGEVRICSWEVGVLVWPELLFTEEEKKGGKSGVMVPCFKQDEPDLSQTSPNDGADTALYVGFRMPYDLPLTPYSAQDIPWCATMAHSQPDWLGQTWEG
jgi:tyrosyl-DNA phosphodiesterase-1